MTNPRQRRKIRGGKVSRRTRSSNTHSLKVGSALIQKSWNNNNTVKDNYENIGLAVRVNENVGSRKLLRRVQAWRQLREQVMTTVNEQRSAAELKAAEEGSLAMLPMDLGEDEIFGHLNALFQKEDSATDAPKPVVAALEAMAENSGAKGVRPLSPDHVEYIAKLHSQYGKDFIRMARDIKLNFMQMTPRQLERMLNKFTLMRAQAEQ